MPRTEQELQRIIMVDTMELATTERVTMRTMRGLLPRLWPTEPSVKDLRVVPPASEMLLELPLAVNPTGCARSEPKLRTHVKRIHNFQRSTGNKNDLDRAAKDMVPFLVGLETIGPYSKNFVQSKASQYRKMKQEWRQNVVLARSKIQGLGLYAARDIDKGQMIIEYIGEVIRSNLTDIREKFYEDQNRGIYMFR